MKFSLNPNPAESIDSDCLIIGLLEDEPLTATADRINQATSGLLDELLASGDISAAGGAVTMLHRVSGIHAQRLLIAGFGKRSELTTSRYHQLAQTAGKTLRKAMVRHAVSSLHETPLKETAPERQIQLSLLGLHDSDYRYQATKKPAPKAAPATAELVCATTEQYAQTIKHSQAIAEGVEHTRQLANLPPNLCTPAHLEAEALALAGQYDKLKVDVLQEEQLRELGMNALLAVGQGSDQGTRMIVLHYRAGGDAPTYALVGKGVTFDSGGLSLKTRDTMEQMKYDMGGAGTVFGVMKACAQMDLPVNLSVIIAAVENMPDGAAYRPSDVITTHEGLTVEVLNTDAEGRLALCDALSWTKKNLQPHTIIDVATLTGAIVTALGAQCSGLMSHDDELCAELNQAGETSGDRIWRLPLWPEYQELLNTPYADMKNIGGPTAGSITAGCFLQRFVKDQRWAHLDIAGSSWPGGNAKGSTGRPVRMLCQWLQDRI